MAPVIARRACAVAIQESHDPLFDSWIATPPKRGLAMTGDSPRPYPTGMMATNSVLEFQSRIRA